MLASATRQDWLASLNVIKSDLACCRANIVAIKAELRTVKWISSGVGFGVLLLALRSFWPA
jgi:hypothetical protein